MSNSQQIFCFSYFSIFHIFQIFYAFCFYRINEYTRLVAGERNKDFFEKKGCASEENYEISDVVKVCQEDQNTIVKEFPNINKALAFSFRPGRLTSQEILQRLFPRQSHFTRNLVLQGCNGDVIKAIEHFLSIDEKIQTNQNCDPYIEGVQPSNVYKAQQEIRSENDVEKKKESFLKEDAVRENFTQTWEFILLNTASKTFVSKAAENSTDANQENYFQMQTGNSTIKKKEDPMKCVERNTKIKQDFVDNCSFSKQTYDNEFFTSFQGIKKWNKANLNKVTKKTSQNLKDSDERTAFNFPMLLSPTNMSTPNWNSQTLPFWVISLNQAQL